MFSDSIRGRSEWRGSQPQGASVFGSSSYNSRSGGFILRAGRGGRGRGGFDSMKPLQNTPNIIENPLGQLLQTLSASALTADIQPSSAAVGISDCKYVASYSWLGSQNPTILVPGRPSRWTPLTQPQRLEEDKGDFYRDPNAAKYPKHPTEPAVRAILECKPRFPTSDIDIFACGSTLGHLLRFVRFQDKPFRFAVEVVGNTVFFVRKENTPTELIEGVRGFGHSFPDAYTSWDADVKESETHQRLIQYDLGGLTCIVRFEVDGYLPTKAKDVEKPSSTSAPVMSGVDDLASAMDAAFLKQPTSGPHKNLDVRSGGSEVPQNSIFDLKTRSGRYGKEINMEDILPALWLKQFQNFIVAYHNGAGLFQDIRVQDVRADLRAWETKNCEALKRLVVLMRKIAEYARAHKDGKLEVYCPSIDRLELHTQYGEGQATLSKAMKEIWAGNHSEFDMKRERTQKHEVRGSADTGSLGIDDEDERDYTACVEESCGYCGRCSY